jgi:hypothetical protein
MTPLAATADYQAHILAAVLTTTFESPAAGRSRDRQETASQMLTDVHDTPPTEQTSHDGTTIMRVERIGSFHDPFCSLIKHVAVSNVR